jgi:hypothetical protein
MAKLSAAFLVVALMVLATACGGSSDSSGGSSSASGSCTGTQLGDNVCIEFGSTYTSSAVQTACTSSNLTYSSSACSATNRVGRCVFTPSQGGTAASYTVSWYTGTAATLQTSCQAINGQGGLTTQWLPN